ncbi:unnamed protein product, partial [Ilex paraguariensis]
MGMVRMFTQEDARQNTSVTEKRVWCYCARRPLPGRADGVAQRNTAATQGVLGEQMASKFDSGVATTSQPGGGSNGVADI